MPVVKLYNNGFTCGNPPSKNDHERGLRKETKGWTYSASRNNTRFLYSVVPEDLHGFGYAFTFTIRDLPSCPGDWEKTRQKLVKRFRRMGMIRLHWLTEWQSRGVPHLHGVVYFPEALNATMLESFVHHWLESAREYNPTEMAQDIKPVTSALGWLEYLSKHASRGVHHYQRNGKPKSWEKTGRMWGKSGEWSTKMSEGEIDLETFHRLRRLIRSWRVADARKPLARPKLKVVNGEVVSEWQNKKRILSAKTCLKHRDKNLSTVLGMSEWIPEPLALTMLDWLHRA